LKIAFNKVSKENKYSLNINNENFSVQANFDIKPKTSSMIFCSLSLRGKLQTVCNRCGVEVEKDIDEQVEFLINNGIYNGFDDEFDVVEALNGFVDFDEITLSELELISSDYFTCGKCGDIEDIEF
jgi:uncharacterized metal-binding protein YceD (DUF177 family)